MAWFRRHIRTGTHLALIALALQFVLALGHVHLPERLSHASAHAEMAVDAVGQALAAPAGDALPGDHHHHHSPADYCMLCAVATQAQAMLASTGLALPTPPLAAETVVTASYDSQAPPRAAAFNRRAPPLV